MPDTPALGLPLLVAEQAQKHVTHNEALRALDAIVQLTVLDRDLTAPPGSPSDGDRYIVGPSATDDWAGHDDEIAAWQDGVWEFYAPGVGWRAWVEDESALLIWTGTAWIDRLLLISVLQDLALLGIGTIADASNPLSAKLNNVLWTAKYDAEGGDGSLRYKMNKETAADILSLLLQTDYSGRAEIGLIGDDDLLFKVSPDGSTWYEAIRVDKDTGEVALLDTLTSTATAGHLVVHDPSAAANYGGFDWGFGFNIGTFTGTGLGGEDHIDTVWGMGINWGAHGNGFRIDDTKAAIGWVLESKYYISGASDYQCEAHLQFFTAGGTGHRIITAGAAHDDSEGSLGPEFSYLSFIDWNGDQRIKWDLAAGAISFANDPVTFQFENNQIYFQQKNAAGTAFIHLPFINDDDVIKFEAPTWAVASAVSSSGKFFNIQPLALSSGQRALAISGPTVANQYYAIEAAGSPSLGMDIGLFNNDSANGTAYARLYLRTLGASSGDPYARFHVNGVTSYALGIDNSDDDAFVLSNGTSPGSSNRLRIDANGVAFGLPAKFPSFAVAGVPSAASAGAGAMIYVTDESGGAVPAFSDGSDWRRVTDRAVIS